MSIYTDQFQSAKPSESNEMEIFRSLQHIHGNNFINNYRPLQPKNGRTVNNNFELEAEPILR